MKEELITIAQELEKFGEDPKELQFWIEFFDVMERGQQEKIVDLYKKELSALKEAESVP